MDYLKQHQWLWTELGSGNDPADGAKALAWQDAFIRYLPQYNTQQPNSTPYGFVHFYHIEYPSVLLGPKDTQLTHLKNGLAYLQKQEYATHLRAHGGLAVVSDPGVLNLSFITDNTHYPLSINAAYQQMVEWIRLALASLNLTVESHEVANSYCPGTYDIVVNHKKIGGIAQRRFKQGVTTAAYISVNGQQHHRAELIKNFYSLSHANTDYPKVNPEAMSSISDFLPQTLSIDTFKKLLIQVIEHHSSITPFTKIDTHLIQLYNTMYQKAIIRNHSLQ